MTNPNFEGMFSQRGQGSDSQTPRLLTPRIIWQMEIREKRKSISNDV